MPMSPAAFADQCREIAARHDGDARHRALDLLVTELLRQLGYGDGMDIFLAAATAAHAEPKPTGDT